MGKLDAELRSSGAAAEINDAPERRFGLVRIKPHAAVGDAAVTLHMRRLDHDEAGARIRQHPDMGKVPIGGATVDGAVLAHGRNDDAIVQLDAAEPDRRKQGTGHEGETIYREGANGSDISIDAGLQVACHAEVSGSRSGSSLLNATTSRSYGVQGPLSLGSRPHTAS